jgi:hypothetical protein
MKALSEANGNWVPLRDWLASSIAMAAPWPRLGQP